VRAVIFDLAGTVIDFGSLAPTSAFMALFRQRGIDITMTDVRADMGLGKRDHLAAILRRPNVAAAWEARMGRSSNTSDIETLYAEFTPIQLDELERHRELVPGALATLVWCRARGLLVGTTTGYAREMQAVVAEALEEQGFRPDTMVCVDDVPAGRPAPWMCLEVAKRLGVYPLDRVVKVGDTPADMAEGIAAHMLTVGVATSGNEVGLERAAWASLLPSEQDGLRLAATARLYEAGADLVIDGVWALPDALATFDESLGQAMSSSL
jgi:phosphonoacetaldehyde hydrolase